MHQNKHNINLNPCSKHKTRTVPVLERCWWVFLPAPWCCCPRCPAHRALDCFYSQALHPSLHNTQTDAPVTHTHSHSQTINQTKVGADGIYNAKLLPEPFPPSCRSWWSLLHQRANPSQAPAVQGNIRSDEEHAHRSIRKRVCFV